MSEAPAAEVLHDSTDGVPDGGKVPTFPSAAPTGSGAGLRQIRRSSVARMVYRSYYHFQTMRRWDNSTASTALKSTCFRKEQGATTAVTTRFNCSIQWRQADLRRGCPLELSKAPGRQQTLVPVREESRHSDRQRWSRTKQMATKDSSY